MVSSQAGLIPTPMMPHLIERLLEFTQDRKWPKVTTTANPHTLRTRVTADENRRCALLV